MYQNLINTAIVAVVFNLTQLHEQLKPDLHSDSVQYYTQHYGSFTPEAKAADSALFRKLDGRTYISFEQRKCIKEHYSKQVKK